MDAAIAAFLMGGACLGSYFLQLPPVWTLAVTISVGVVVLTLVIASWCQMIFQVVCDLAILKSEADETKE